VVGEIFTPIAQEGAAYLRQLDTAGPPACVDATSVSAPDVSHRSAKIDCRHRAIVDFPELEPQFSTITSMRTTQIVAARLVPPAVSDPAPRGREIGLPYVRPTACLDGQSTIMDPHL
jgi:hypothetical protein